MGLSTLLQLISCCTGRGDQAGDASAVVPATGLLTPRATAADARGTVQPRQLRRPRARALSTADAPAAVAALDRASASEPRLRTTLELAARRLSGGKLTEWQRAWCTPETVRRYLRGRKGDPVAASEILAQALAWRHEHEEVLSGRKEPRWQTDLRVVARGDEGHPITYGCFRHNVRVTQDNLSHVVDHMAAVMEAAGHARRGGATQGDTIMDCHGFRLADNMNPAPSLALMRMANQPYRDCLRMAIIVDAPRTFQVLWRAARPLMSETTQDKIHFVTREECVEVVGRRSGARAAQTLDRIMGLNRTNPEGCKPSALPCEVEDSDKEEEEPDAPPLHRALRRRLTDGLKRVFTLPQAPRSEGRGLGRALGGLVCCRRRNPGASVQGGLSRLGLCGRLAC